MSQDLGSLPSPCHTISHLVDLLLGGYDRHVRVNKINLDFEIIKLKSFIKHLALKLYDSARNSRNRYIKYIGTIEGFQKPCISWIKPKAGNGVPQISHTGFPFKLAAFYLSQWSRLHQTATKTDPCRRFTSFDEQGIGQ